MFPHFVAECHKTVKFFTVILILQLGNGNNSNRHHRKVCMNVYVHTFTNTYTWNTIAIHARHEIISYFSSSSSNTMAPSPPLKRAKKFYRLFSPCSACSGVTVMGHISSSTAFEHRFALPPPSSQWGAEMEVNFKPSKRCHKLHLMAFRACSNCRCSPKTTHLFFSL